MSLRGDKEHPSEPRNGGKFDPQEALRRLYSGSSERPWNLASTSAREFHIHRAVPRGSIRTSRKPFAISVEMIHGRLDPEFSKVFNRARSLLDASR